MYFIKKISISLLFALQKQKMNFDVYFSQLPDTSKMEKLST